MAVHRDWLNGGVYSLIWRYLNAKGLTRHTLVVFQFDNLRLQIARSSWGRRRRPPYGFTEQGIAMLLNSKRAIAVNIAIMRTFVRLRQLLATHEELARRLEQVEARQNEQGQKIELVFEAIQHLIEAPVEPKPAFQGREVVLPFSRQYAIPNRTAIQSQIDAVAFPLGR